MLRTLVFMVILFLIIRFGLYLDTSQDNVASNNTLNDNLLCMKDLVMGLIITIIRFLVVLQWTYISLRTPTSILVILRLTGMVWSLMVVRTLQLQQNTITNSSIAILSDAENVTIRNNTLINNDVGLDIDDYLGYNNITLNNISGSTVGITGAYILHVYNNYFNNTLDINNSNASSTFNTTKTLGTNIIGGPYIGGNFYASYAGVDSDGDGLGDTPFNDSGNMSVPDFLPLMYGGSAPAFRAGT